MLVQSGASVSKNAAQQRVAADEGGSRGYILVYRTRLSATECDRIVNELSAVWSVAQSRADAHKARFASIFAEGGGAASLVATYRRRSEGWTPSQPVLGCEPAEMAAER